MLLTEAGLSFEKARGDFRLKASKNLNESQIFKSIILRKSYMINKLRFTHYVITWTLE